MIKGKKLEQIAAKIAEPFGVAVTAEVDTGPAIPVFAVLPGESPFEAITRAAIGKNLVVTSNAAGQLVLMRSGTARAHDAIIQGQNLLSGSSRSTDQDRYSHYIVEGQGDGQGKNNLRAVYRDPAVTRYRPKIIHADGKSTLSQLQKRAEWEARSSAARSSEASITVQGWRQSNGDLWAVNRIVTVESKKLNLTGDLLISEVTFEVGTAGTLTGLRLTRPDAYSSAETLDATKDAVKQARLVKKNGQ